jgi:glycine/D-amino acid oxidase-like deaminating enzyme
MPDASRAPTKASEMDRAVTSDTLTGLWAASLTEAADTAPFAGDTRADLAIVGGGFTGCAAALEAASAGASVVLLEAKSIGYGGSGRNAGLVNAGLWLPPDAILAQMGEPDGRRLIDALARAPDHVFDRIDRHGIACEATRNGTLHLAHAPGGLADLQNRHRQSNAHGMALHLLDAEETRRRTGSAAFHGALLNPSAGTVQPLAYCHGLARAALQAGARLFTESPVTHIARDGSDWVIRANGHSLRAGALLVATNAYPLAGGGPGVTEWTPVHYSQFATAPLLHEMRDRVLPGREGCWDTAPVMSSIRLDAAGRLIVGGMGNAEGAAGAIHAGWARRKLRALFPELADQPFEHQWTGRIAMTRDHVPKILSLGPSGYAIFGYSGRGIAPGTVFGTAAARALLQDAPDLLPVPLITAYSEPMTRLKGAIFELGATLTHLLPTRA